eukprot:2324319-Alexandrium_andersonii.AAC.1
MLTLVANSTVVSHLEKANLAQVFKDKNTMDCAGSASEAAAAFASEGQEALPLHVRWVMADAPAHEA